jgi:hypothetical protein
MQGVSLGHMRELMLGDEASSVQLTVGALLFQRLVRTESFISHKLTLRERFPCPLHFVQLEASVAPKS